VAVVPFTGDTGGAATLAHAATRRTAVLAPADATGSARDCEAMRRAKKMAAPCGTAKFREETSKKADSATRAAMLRCTK
jgi:hypothetical protein